MKLNVDNVVYLLKYFNDFTLEYINIASTEYIVDTFRKQALAIQVNLGNVSKASADFVSSVLNFKDNNINTYVSEVQDILYVISYADMTHQSIMESAEYNLREKMITKRTYDIVKKLVKGSK